MSDIALCPFGNSCALGDRCRRALEKPAFRQACVNCLQKGSLRPSVPGWGIPDLAELQRQARILGMDPAFGKDQTRVSMLFSGGDAPELDKNIALWAIAHLCDEAYGTAKVKGWHDTPREDGTLIALMHSELSEALEAMRKPDKKDEHLPNMSAVGLELADVLIRIFDYCGSRKIDLAACVVAKMEYNDTRPHRHGGKKF